MGFWTGCAFCIFFFKQKTAYEIVIEFSLFKGK